MRNNEPHTWHPDWQNGVVRAAQAKGFNTLISFLASMPNRPYADVAAALGGHIAPIQIVSVQYQEARSPDALRDAAKDALCRNIVEKLPQGFGTGEDAAFKWVLALTSWGSELQVTGGHPELRPTIRRIQDKLKPAQGWLPLGPDDPVIAQVFDTYWPPRR